jgi:hypothetical protein
MSNSSQEQSSGVMWLLMFLFGLPLILILLKTPGLPTADFLMRHDSLTNLPLSLQHKASHILFVPLGAMLVVFFRLTLGIRVLGPFRSVLLVAAFQVTGIPLGLFFLAVIIAIVATVRAQIRSIGLPLFGRITLMLSVVAVLMIVGILASDWLQLDFLRSIAYFPIVVLCLIADAFARTMKKEGAPSALWRGCMTALMAVVLTWLAGVSQVRHLLLAYPELLIAQIGGIVVISKFLAFRWFNGLNPRAPTDDEGEAEDDDEGEDEQANAVQVEHSVSPKPMFPRSNHSAASNPALVRDSIP